MCPAETFDAGPHESTTSGDRVRAFGNCRMARRAKSYIVKWRAPADEDGHLYEASPVKRFLRELRFLASQEACVCIHGVMVPCLAVLSRSSPQRPQGLRLWAQGLDGESTRRLAAMCPSGHTSTLDRHVPLIGLQDSIRALISSERRPSAPCRSPNSATGRSDAVGAGHGDGIRFVAPRYADGHTVRSIRNIWPLGEADVAFRTAPPQDDALVSRKLADVPWGVFASRSYIEKHGQPEQAADINMLFGVGSERRSAS
jgi:hypothetical protein